MAEEKVYSQTDIQTLMANMSEKPVSEEQNLQKTEAENFKSLQIAHLSLKMMIEEQNLESMSCISEEDRDDFANAEYINTWLFQDPMYNTFKESYFKMSRSVSTASERKPFYQGLFDMVSSSFMRSDTEDPGSIRKFIRKL